jgi:predicted deacetylase
MGAARVFALRPQIKARLLTSGEAEFLWLTAREMDDRLTQGIEIFEWCIGARPTTFVAPVWLYLPALLGTLRRAGIRFTEDHRRVHDLRARRWLDARVLSWATRSRLHRYGSLIHSAAWLQMMQEQSLIRIALHPHDVDPSGDCRRHRACRLDDRRGATARRDR